ncbi:hypothetical protein ABIF78_000044 [Bradyrhizobium japonicum]
MSGVGAQGRAAHLKDVRKIRKRGEIPLLLFALADSETMVATTTGVPRPTVH